MRMQHTSAILAQSGRVSTLAAVVLGLIVAIVAAVIGFIGYLVYCDSPSRWPMQRFTPATWQASPPPQRYLYVKDLQQSKRLEGLDTREVEALLGAPDLKSSVRIWSGFDSFHLTVQFSASGQVEKVMGQSD